MALSEDQKAMLRLLAQREQGYDDIAALMGLSVEQVRERVKDALSQLEEEGSGEPRPAGPVAAGDPPPPPVAKASSGAVPPTAPPPGEESPAQPLPVPPPAPEEPSSQAAPAPQGPGAPKGANKQGLPKIALPDSQGARTAIAAGALALVVLVVVLVVGGGGDESGTTASNSGGTAASGEPASGNAKEVTKAVLEAVDGSEATGVAIFGRVKNSLALQVEAEGLEPTAKGTSYAIWLAQSPQKMLPLASTAVGQDGRIATQFAAPVEVLPYLADETFTQIAITEASDSQLKAALSKATDEGQTPSYTGTEVLRGTITGPIVGAAKGGN